jgi:hypothetical protein
MKGIIMSKLLYLTCHQGIVHHTSGVGRSTSILFSIDDRKRLAWYLFNELSRDFNVEEMEDLEDNKPHAAYSVFGQPTKAGYFHPRNDLEVDQFANGDYLGTKQVRAHTSTEFLKNRIYIGMTLFLKSGPENLTLDFQSKKPALHVRHHEQGRVHLLKVEKYSAGAITSPLRVRDYTLSPVYKE